MLCFDDCCVSPLCSLSKKKEERNKDVVEIVLDDDLFQDDPKDLNYQPQNQRYAYVSHFT